MRFALALREAGTLVGAGAALRVDPTTVGRRVSALEDDLGVRLFVRTPGHWGTTPAGARVLSHAAIGRESMRAAFSAAQEELAPRGLVRLTTLESIATHLLVPVLPALAQTYPELELVLRVTDQVLDLSSGQVEIALRVGQPRRPELVGRRLAQVRERFYAAPSLLERLGLDARSLANLEGLPVVVLQGRGGLHKRLGMHRRVLSTNSTSALRAAVVAGLGVGLLPDLLVGPGSGLIPLPRLPSNEELPVWLVTHPDLAQLPRVRVVMDFLAASAVFQGEGPAQTDPRPQTPAPRYLIPDT